MTRQEYIRIFGPAMAKACRGTGLFASVMIAQGIIELSIKQPNGSWSPDEKNPLFVANNHFGIKDQVNDEWKGKNILIRTWEWLKGKRVEMNDTFRSYASYEEGFADRVKFLQMNARYKKAGVFAAGTPEEQANRLHRAGYATGPTYSQDIISIVNKYGLRAYDSLS